MTTPIASTAQMRAVTQQGYGSPDVLELREAAAPTPKADEVLIRVRAAGVNAADVHLMRGDPRAVRLVTGLRTPRQPILGADVSGVVEAVGADVTEFRPGDEVMAEVMRGGYAELAAVAASRVAPKPRSLGFTEAAVLPVPGVTALVTVRDAGRVGPGQRVLVNGASGAVGHLAVQIAVALGAEVTAVCSTRNVELVRSLGAAHVVDYTTDDFTLAAEPYDVVIDTVGNRTLSECRRVLTPRGRYVLVGAASSGHWLGMGRQLRMMLTSPFVKQSLVAVMNKPSRTHLQTLTGLVDSGSLRPVVNRTFPLAEAPDALRFVEAGHARGKVVIEL